MKFVSASLIGRARFCAMAAYLQVQGVKPDRSAVKRIEMGVRGHQRLTEKAKQQAAPKRDSRCYVATFAYGTAHPVTNELREWRDSKLQATMTGRWLVKLYYLASPILVDLSVRFPKLGWLLRGWVYLAAFLVLGKRGGK